MVMKKGYGKFKKNKGLCSNDYEKFKNKSL